MTHEEAIERAHSRAVAAGEALYRDPRTGCWVMTRQALLDRGHCCENGCRHCPYGFAK